PASPPPYTLSLHDALPIFQALERETAVAPCGPRRHGHRDEDDLADLRVARPRLACPPGVGIDTPRALGDVGDAERDQLLRLRREDRKSTRLNSSHDQISYA